MNMKNLVRAVALAAAVAAAPSVLLAQKNQFEVGSKVLNVGVVIGDEVGGGIGLGAGEKPVPVDTSCLDSIAIGSSSSDIRCSKSPTPDATAAEPTRYTPVHEDAMVCESDGTYVRYDDYVKLRALIQEVCDNNHSSEDARAALLDAQEIFRSQGFTPTNTTDHGQEA